jgi:HK97 family phage major capsid protein
LVANYEAAIQPSLDEGRDLDQPESDALDVLRERIEGIDRQIDRWTAAETLLARQAQPVRSTVPGDRPGTSLVPTRGATRIPAMSAMGYQQPIARRTDYKGADFTRWAIALCVAGRQGAADYALQRWGDEELSAIIRHLSWYGRAPTTPMGGGPGAISPSPPTDGTGGGFLVRIEHLGEEFIEMLRPLLIVARMPNMRRLEFDAAGTLLIPRQTAGVAGGYVGEGGTIRVERLTFGQLQLTPSKLAVIVPTTNELLYRSSPGVEQLVRDDMLQGTARTIDTVFFSVLGPGPGPAGILFPAAPPAGSRFVRGGYIPAYDAGPPIIGGVTDVTEALKNMILALRMQNVPMLAPVWIFNARTKEFLRLLRTNQEIFAFKAEIDAGTLLGYPIIDTTNIPIGAAAWPPAGVPPVGGNATTTAYALIDASQLIWAEDMLPMIDASEHASILSDSAPPNLAPVPPPETPVAPGAGYPPGSHPAATLDPGFYSAFQNDMVFMRIRMRHTWARRHDVAVVYSYSEE